MTAAARPGTRERILAEAAELFATRGYGATSTRDISATVGIRQPSLFHHFPTKAAILAELLDRSLDDAVPLARRWAGAEGPAADRLHAYLIADFTAVLGSPVNLAGVYSDEVLRDAEFSRYAEQIAELDSALREMIRQGVTSGEFRPVDPELCQTMIAGLEVGLIRARPALARRDPGAAARQAADFAVRGLLATPAQLNNAATLASVSTMP